ncbi:MAG: UDP-4-amino-4,6-dideoxy-N-acetyl-beta-L-altrosamine transaminase [Planctomycetota bacterium]
MLPYGRHCVSEEDIQSVVDVLRGDWLTTGPVVERFERAFAGYVGTAGAVAVSSGTAALHAAMFALGVGPGDEVIVPAMTFAATANCVVYQGGTPVFADVDAATLLLGPAQVRARLTPRTKAIIAVDYAGQPCDYRALRSLAEEHGLALVADGSHALGGRDRGQPVGSLAELSAFSLHAVKPITTGEGGMITTDDCGLAERMRRFRNHGFSRDHRQRERSGSWFYEMTELGCNYRLTDFQSALGLGQLPKLDGWIDRRRQITAAYDRAFAQPFGGAHESPTDGRLGLRPLGTRDGASHARHLYVIRVDRELLGVDRAEVFAALRSRGIGAGVHYIPVHLHPFYRERFGTGPGDCPVAEAAYEEILSLPVFPAMTDPDVADVVEAVWAACGIRSQESGIRSQESAKHCPLPPDP